jgi:hypothetical protein
MAAESPKKRTQNEPNSKPIQTQSKPIAERVKLMQSLYLQRIMKEMTFSQFRKTKPIQTQTKPITNPTTVFLLITQEIATALRAGVLL